MNLWKESLERRVPQYVGGYLVGAWGLLQFIIFIESRYRLAGNLVELVGGVLLLLFPSVVMLAWAHGRPGKDRWTRTQGWTTAINLLIAAAVVFVFFRGKELGAVTQTIELTDENGETIAREVPKADLIQRMTLFPFVNETDSELDWISLGFPELLTIDLYQSPFLDIKSPSLFASELREANFDPRTGRLPRPIQIETARRFNTPWFVSGVLSRSDEGFVATTDIINTRTGQTQATHVLRSPDIMDLVDLVSKRLREESDLPAWAIEESVDLPVRDIVSESLEATAALLEGVRFMVVDRDFATAAARLDEATTIDPSFAMAHLFRFIIQSLLQNVDTANESISLAVEHDYRLPERMQFMARSNYYLRVKHDPDRAFAVAEMWAQIYPYDLDSHRSLMMFHFMRGEQDEAIKRLQRMVEISPTDRELARTLGVSQLEAGDLDDAAQTLRDYVKQHPKDWEGYHQLGRVEIARGNLDAALSHLEKATLMEANNIDVLLELATVEKRLGRYEETREQLEEAFAVAKTPDDSLSVLSGLREFHRLLGQYETALKYQDQARAISERVQVPTINAELTAASMWLHCEAERFTDGRRLMAATRASLDPQFRPLASAGEAILAIGERKFEEAELLIEEVQGLGDQFKLAPLQDLAQLLRAELALENSDPETAASLYESLLDASDSTSHRRRLSICYLQMGRFEDARRLIEEALESRPFSPRNNLQLARVLQAQEDISGAIEALEITLDAWKDADEGNGTIIEAEELMQALRSDS